MFVVIFGVQSIALYFGKKHSEGIRPLPRLKGTPPVVFFFILILLMFASTAYNGLTYEALYGDSYRQESLFLRTPQRLPFHLGGKTPA